MRELQLVQVSDFIQVAVNQEISYLEVTWFKQHPSALFRQEILTVLDYITHYGLTRLLYNIRQRPYLEMADQNWLIQKIIPGLKELDLKLAYVVNPLSLSVMDITRVQDAMAPIWPHKASLSVEMFWTKELALEWLFA